MDLNVPITRGIHLRIADQLKEQSDYATSRLAKGFLLVVDGQQLAEEAVGFGFPVIKRGLQTLFPGRIGLVVGQNGPTWTVQAEYSIDLIEKIQMPGIGSVKSRLLYKLKNILAALIRFAPLFRGLLTAISSGLRKAFGWKTIYEESGFHATITTIHTIHEETGKIEVEVRLADLPDGITEVVLMNEQGAHYFDRYLDSTGTALLGREIGCWDEVTAGDASFLCTTPQVVFKLGQAKGARLFRGRELVGSRLAWAGFGYSFPPSIKRFVYELGIERSA